MDELLLIGLNYRIAPVEVRERLAFVPERIPQALQALAGGLPGGEVALLSTCNRTEIYLSTPERDAGLAAVTAFLAGHAGLAPQALPGMVYIRYGEDAAHHLLRVAAGLDSLVTGENEILGQVKDAYQQALAARTCACQLSALFQHALQAGKQAHAQTEIGQARQSVASVVVALASQIDPNLANHTALLIGAGKISSMTARALTRAGLRCILIANRTFERAQKLAQALGGQAVHFDSLEASLVQADIVICSTGAPHTVLHAGSVQRAMAARAGRPLLIADLAVPRDVDPEVAGIHNVRLANIDDLEALVPRLAPLSVQARQQAEDVVCDTLEALRQWSRQRQSAGVIAAMQKQAEAICQVQVGKTMRRLGLHAPEQQAALEVMANAVANKLLHSPIQHLKACPPDGMSQESFVALVSELFGLCEPN
jgi:glutamyl-tRNA reductase